MAGENIRGDIHSTELKKILEAILFMSGDPLTLEEISKKIRQNPEIIEPLLNELITEYENRESAITIIKKEDTYYMTVRENYKNIVNDLGAVVPFTKAQMKVLALVALKGPLKQSDVVKIIGNRAYEYIKELERIGFLSSERWKNTKILKVTPKFHAYFGEPRGK